MIRFRYDFEQSKEKIMKNLKSTKGITMIALVITIIVLLILSGIGLTMGLDATKQAQDSKLITELEIVQHAIFEQYTKYKLTKDPSTLVGLKVDISQVQEIANRMGVTLVSISSTYEPKDYYRLDKASLLALGITNTSDEYIVNYISGEVINITIEKTTKDKPLYTKANSFLTK